jgi:DNA polymerase III delta prime subunit
MKIINNKSSIFYEKYKPQCIEDLILPSELKSKLQTSVNTQKFPHMLLASSVGGTGKSVTANAILKEIGGEALWINASLENGIDTLRGKIQKFVSTSSFDDNIKIVVMDEADHMSANALAAFRGFLDEFGDNCVFIFTCNFKEKIIEPLLTRLQIFDFNNFSKEEMIKPIFERLKFILENENIKYEPKDLVPVINTYYPSIRNMIGALQKLSHNGEFKLADLDDTNIYDKVMQFVTVPTYLDMITEVNKLNAPENMYTFLYKNASKYFSQSAYPKVIVTIAKYQHMSSTVRDRNLNLAACLTELVGLRQ